MSAHFSTICITTAETYQPVCNMKLGHKIASPTIWELCSVSNVSATYLHAAFPHYGQTRLQNGSDPLQETAYKQANATLLVKLPKAAALTHARLLDSHVSI